MHRGHWGFGRFRSSYPRCDQAMYSAAILIVTGLTRIAVGFMISASVLTLVVLGRTANLGSDLRFDLITSGRNVDGSGAA